MILRVRRYYEQELRTGHHINLEKIIECAASPTGVSGSTVCKIKTERNARNRRFKTGENLQVAQKCAAPKKFLSIVRQIIRVFSLRRRSYLFLIICTKKFCDSKVEDVCSITANCRGGGQ